MGEVWKAAKPPVATGRRHEWLLVLALIAMVAVLGVTGWATQRSVLDDVKAEIERKLDVYAAYLGSEIRRFDLMPDIMSVAPAVHQLLRRPDDQAAVAAANAYLAEFARVTGASAAYVMAPDGMTLAASNHMHEGTFIGSNYGFRPYFKAAAAGGRGRYVAVGATSNVPGYYVAVPVHLDGVLAGVAAVKYTAEALVPWTTSGGDKVLVAAEDEIVFAANDSGLQFNRLDRLLGAPTQRVDPLQYGSRNLPDLPLHQDQWIGETRVVTLEPPSYWGEHGLRGQPAEYAVGVRDLAESGWRIVVLAKIDSRLRQIVVNGIIVALALGLMLLLGSYFEQRRRYMRTLYENAIRDPLTRLYTRLYMNDVVGRMLQGHDRGSLAGVALVLFDVDHFKRVNDTHGHHVGDQVLAGVADIILETARATDVAVRFGGEEIAVFLPTDRMEDARQFAERIRRRVEATPFDVVAGTLRLTLSGGVALHRPGEQLSQLVVRADAALYAAKRDGRNRILLEAAEETAPVSA